MIKEDLIIWAEEKFPLAFEKYIYLESQDDRKEVLREIAEKRFELEPEFVIGFHPNVLKKLNVNFRLDSIPVEISKLIKKTSGKYLYTLILKEEK